MSALLHLNKNHGNHGATMSRWIRSAALFELIAFCGQTITVGATNVIVGGLTKKNQAVHQAGSHQEDVHYRVET